MITLLLAAFSFTQAADLDAKIAAVVPSANEDRWLQIPWRQDLAAALKEGEREKKPIYMWVMDGNPLGCT
jgi:hypothetical protein